MGLSSRKRKDADAAPPPGSSIDGRYRVGAPIAIGGMGVVVNAYDEVDKRAVAIKILRHSNAGSAEHTGRLLREARSLLELDNEHLVRVLDVGALDSEQPYLVMEKLDGSDLEHVLRADGPLSVGRAVDYVIQACVGLAVAHRRGVVHRDVKPSNLFLAEQPMGEPIIKVIDFGVCKAGFTGGPALTLDRHVLGSPSYMSPEQCQSSRAVDARGDIWSLGVVLHRLVSARLPFEGQTTAEKMFHIATSPPVPLRLHYPAAPVALEQVVLRCLSKDREERYDDVAELADALSPLTMATSRSFAKHARELLPEPDVLDEETVLRAPVDDVPTLPPPSFRELPTKRPPRPDARAQGSESSPWVTRPAPALLAQQQRRKWIGRAALVASCLLLAGAMVLAAM